MRPKIPDLQRALVGYISDHRARLCRRMLDHIDSLTATTTELTADSCSIAIDWVEWKVEGR